MTNYQGACPPITVFVGYGKPAFAHGVRALLADASGVRIVGMESDAERVVASVREMRPDVIVLEELETRCWPLVSLLEISLQHRVIALGLDNTLGCTYRASPVHIESLTSLISAIQAKEGEAS